MMRPALVVLALSAIGCGYGPSSTLACADLAKERCTRRDACFGPFENGREFGDLQTCLLREQLACTLAASAPGATSPLATDHCAIAMESISCSDLLTSAMPPECLSHGPRGNGAPCTFNAQCTSGYCANDKTADCGTCASPPQAGDSCAASNCANGMVCLQRTQECQPLGIMGASCDVNTLPCGADLSCANNVGGQMGICQPAITTVGTRCGGTLGGCGTGLACTGVTTVRTCQPIALAPNGQPCGSLPDGTVAVCAAGDCYTATGIALAGGVGTCKTFAADGQPCDTALGPTCMIPARCIVSGGGTAGMCKLPSAASCG